MIQRLIPLLFLLLAHAVSGQNNDYFNLKDVRTFRFEHLELSSEKDVATFISRAEDYNFIEALKINETVQLDRVLASLGKFYSLKELNLSNYSGDFTEHSFDSCEEIETLHLHINEEKLEQLRYIKSCKKLSALYLYIQGKPLNLTPLKTLVQVKELHLIGDFLPKDLGIICANLTSQSYLNILGLSIDRVTDLPSNITKLRKLGKLNLYDNLSVYSNKGIDELSEEKINIVFNVDNDAMSGIAVSYFSNNGRLSDFEIAYLEDLYKGQMQGPQYLEEEVVQENKVNIPFRKEFVPDFTKTQEFSPPYPSITPSGEVFVIDPANHSVIYASSGLKVTIPAHSFINPSGENITDPVYIKVTQITQASEMLFAGLDLQAGHRQLVNRFVFNIQATTEKSAAILNNGYQLKVTMPVSPDSAASYFFDYESNSWQDLDFYNQVFANNFVPTDFYKIESGSHIPYYQFDTSSFHARFYGPHHYFLNDRLNGNQLLFRRKNYYTDLDRPWNKEFNKSGQFSGIRIRNGKSYVKLQKVVPKVRNRERQYFKVLDKTEQHILPELKPLKNINFNVVINPENKKEFSENYVRDARYIDVRVNYTPGKEYCEIMLKTVDGYRKLVANITDSDDKDIIKKQVKKFMKAYTRYVKIREKRAVEFNELNMARYDEFKAFSQQKVKALEKEKQTAEMKVQQLGTFGLMYMVEPVFSTNLIAQYTDINGLPIDIKDLFLVDSRYNTVIRVSPGNITFDPATTQYMVATDYSGNLYYATRSDIAASNLNNNALTYIRLKKANSNLNNVIHFNNLIR